VPRRLAIAKKAEAGLAELRASQDQVLSRAQLAELGFDRHAVAHRVATHRWRAVGSRVVVLATGELTWRQRMWVAVLHAGPASALADLTGAQAEGLTGFESSTLHVVVPHGSDGTDLVDRRAGVTVRVRQSRRLDEARVHPAHMPRRLRLPEAIVGAAAAAPSDDRARLLLVAPVQQRLLVPHDLRDAIDDRIRVRRRNLMLECVDDIEGGAHSLPEADWTRAIRRYRLPEPTRQRKVQRADGTWYLDADFEEFLVGVEINGSQHLVAGALVLDDHRRNVLGTGGRLVITIASRVVRHRRGQAVVATAAALLSRGWSPEPHVLARLETLARAEQMDLRTGDWLRRAG
jgi:hypothetical protein